MDYILDTNILVHFIRNDEYIRQLENKFSLFSSGNRLIFYAGVFVNTNAQ